MSKEIYDGFDSYATADIGLRWPTNGGNAISTTAPRTGAKHLHLNGTGFAQRPLSGNLATVIMGGAFQVSAIDNNRVLMSIYDNGTVQVDVRMDTSGHLLVTRNGTVLGTSTATVPPVAYFHAALSATIHNSTGAYELRLNNVNILSATGVNTRATANNYATDVRLGLNNTSTASASTLNIYVDDVFVYNTSGTSCNAFPGDIALVCLTVNGNGSTQNFTPSTGSDNSANVDDATPDSDSTYNSSATVGHIDLYNFTNSAISGIVGVQLCSIVRKDAGTVHHAAVCKSGATVSVGAVDTSLGTSYQACLDSFDLDPNTGLPWTVSGLNAAEFGSKFLS